MNKPIQIFGMPEIQLISPKPTFGLPEHKEIKFHARFCNLYYTKKDHQNVKAPSLDDVINAATEACFTVPSAALSKSRKEFDVLARMIIFTYLDSNVGMTLSRMGKIAGKRNHATVLAARRRYSELIDSDKILNSAQERFTVLIAEKFPKYGFLMKKRK
jgi:chromosomal replication initiation ATPase DnaA